MDYGTIRDQIRLLVDPLLLKFREELMGSGVSFGRLQSGAMPVTTITAGGDGGTIDISDYGYITGVSTYSGGTLKGTAQKELNFVNMGVTVAGVRTTVTGPDITATLSGYYTKTEIDARLTYPRQLSWYENSTLAVANSNGPLRRIDATVTLSGCYIYVKTAPTGASIIVDIKRSTTGPNGTYTTIFSSTPSISAAAYTGSSTSFSISSLSAGDYIRMDITQVGSTIAGAGLTVDLNVRGSM